MGFKAYRNSRSFLTDGFKHDFAEARRDAGADRVSNLDELERLIFGPDSDAALAERLERVKRPVSHKHRRVVRPFQE